jgi:hypothetical protein
MINNVWQESTIETNNICEVLELVEQCEYAQKGFVHNPELKTLIAKKDINEDEMSEMLDIFHKEEEEC